jgi:hypothetical protein
MASCQACLRLVAGSVLLSKMVCTLPLNLPVLKRQFLLGAPGQIRGGAARKIATFGSRPIIAAARMSNLAMQNAA